MKPTRFAPVVLAVLIALAGCTGGFTGDLTDSSTAIDGGAGAGTDGQSLDGGATQSGTVQFYISDEKNAIGDFRHLNVTISRVGFQQADDADNSGWVEREVDDRTVDLTRLLGSNATLVDAYEMANGTYTKTFVYVSTVNATLEDGTQVRVKLPSEKLHINEEFTVGQNESVDFVFDIAVHKAGNSGKYILKPVVSQSGTDVPITDVDRERKHDHEREHLRITTNGTVAPGENATITVRDDGEQAPAGTQADETTATPRGNPGTS
jgi:hypothetical protein